MKKLYWRIDASTTANGKTWRELHYEKLSKCEAWFELTTLVFEDAFTEIKLSRVWLEEREG